MPLNYIQICKADYKFTKSREKIIHPMYMLKYLLRIEKNKKKFMQAIRINMQGEGMEFGV